MSVEHKVSIKGINDENTEIEEKVFPNEKLEEITLNFEEKEENDEDDDDIESITSEEGNIELQEIKESKLIEEEITLKDIGEAEDPFTVGMTEEMIEQFKKELLYPNVYMDKNSAFVEDVGKRKQSFLVVSIMIWSFIALETVTTLTLLIILISSGFTLELGLTTGGIEFAFCYFSPQIIYSYLIPLLKYKTKGEFIREIAFVYLLIPLCYWTLFFIPILGWLLIGFIYCSAKLLLVIEFFAVGLVLVDNIIARIKGYREVEEDDSLDVLEMSDEI